MTLHFHWLHAPRWMAHAHFSRAVTLVLGVIVVSLLFSALRVLDAAVSDGLIQRPALAIAPAASVPAQDPTVNDPARARPVDASVVDVPDAAIEAISL